MKHKYINIAFILILLIGMQACTKDFLELSPKDGLVEDNFYQTESDAFLALVAGYDALSVQNWQFVPTMSDIFSDDCFKGGSDAKDMEQFYEIESGKMTAENNSAFDLWNRCYSGVYRVNLYLQKQDGINWETEGLKERYEAEARFLRAYFYWDIVRHYGWAPIITEVLPNVEDYKSLTQNTPDEIYTQIASDLLAAITSLPATVSDDEKGRATKYAAEALLARIYLYHEGFAKPVLGTGEFTDGTTVVNKTYAQNALEDIINNGPYQLLNDYADVFDWANQNNDESIFEFQYSAKNNSSDWGGWGIDGNFSSTWMAPRDPNGDPTIAGVIGWSLSTVSWSLVNEFEAGDPRYDVTVYDAEANLTNYTRAYQNTGYFSNKYMGKAAYTNSIEQSHNWSRNYMDMRYADVLLMASELFLTDNPTKALDYLNEVRTRSLGAGAELVSISLDAIYHERRVELACEGQRKWDLLRRGFAYTKQMVDESFVLPGGVSKPGDYVNLGFVENTYGMFPIPAGEIRNTNSGALKQYVPAYQ